MGLKKALFFLSVLCVSLSLVLVLLVFYVCGAVREGYPQGGLSYSFDGGVTLLEQPTREQQRILSALAFLELFSCAALPLAGLGTAGLLFYHIKLKEPLALLRDGTAHIQAHDLSFSLPAVSSDELGQLCAAFETMRLELLKTNRELWRQAEERKRLNAAFAHDLRNPITVLKGSLKILRQNPADAQALDRLESYTLRIEQYVEAMSSIQRMEQLPVRCREVALPALRAELEETAACLAPGVRAAVSVPEGGTVRIDHGILLTIAENLMGNAARFARAELALAVALQGDTLSLSVTDDGPGFPAELLKSGPKPFGRLGAGAGHFGMGLYSCRLLCLKHGGDLRLENRPAGGASATATLQIGPPSCAS